MIANQTGRFINVGRMRLPTCSPRSYWRCKVSMVPLRSLSVCTACVTPSTSGRTLSTSAHGQVSKAPLWPFRSMSPCRVTQQSPIRHYSNGRAQLPIIYLFTKDRCSLCDEAKEKLAPHMHRFRLVEVDIERPENRVWREKYQYDIPVFHLHLFQHRVDLSLLEGVLDSYENRGNPNANTNNSCASATSEAPSPVKPVPKTTPQSKKKPIATTEITTTEIYIDLETTGLERTSHITQLAAVRGGDHFSCYVMPELPISHKASEITGLRVRLGKMYRHGEQVNTLRIKDAFTEFFDFLQKTDNNILIGHNIKSFDCPVILSALNACDKMDMLKGSVAGFLDTLKLFRLTHPTLPSHKQISLMRSLVDADYDAHNALEDAIALQTLVASLGTNVVGMKQEAMFSVQSAITAYSIRKRVKPHVYLQRKQKQTH